MMTADIMEVDFTITEFMMTKRHENHHGDMLIMLAYIMTKLAC